MTLIVFAITSLVLISFLILLILPVLNFNFRKHLGLHAWQYRNPHNKTCYKCGRNKVEHRYSWQSNSMGFWETFKEGNGRSIICKKD